LKILLACGRDPWPARRGDQLRAVQLLEALHPRHQVTLLAPFDRPPPVAGASTVSYRRDSPARHLLAVLRAVVRGLPAQSGLFADRGLRAAVERLAPRHDLVVLQLVRLVGLLAVVGTTPVVTDLIDAMSLNFLRRAHLDRWWLRAPLAGEARRLLAAERRMVGGSRTALVVSERDREVLAAALPAPLGRRLRVVPLAVAAEVRTPPPPDGPPCLVLTGNLGYFPNDDAARWWLRRVWPELRAARPEVRLVLAGARPSRRLREEAARGGAELVADPASLHPVLGRATIALAPLRAGSGTPLKILEAWAAGVPVVASPWAAAGVGPGAEEAVVTAEGPAEWIDAVQSLFDDALRCRALVEAGHRRLAEVHAPERVREAWQRAVEAALPLHLGGDREARPRSGR
jgi:glycosyltransferase involved in cell wall biosynthesis